MDILTAIFTFLPGFAFVAGILVFMYRRHAETWQQIAEAYPNQAVEALRTWHLQNIYIHQEGLIYQSHTGIVKICLTETGLRIDTPPPFCFIQAPFFVPYEDITAYHQDWMLMGNVCQVEFQKIPKLKVVIPGDTGDLLLDYTNPLFRKMKRLGLSGQPCPFGHAA